MRTTLPLFTAAYLDALGRHLKDEAEADRTSARRLGERALSVKVETLEMAKIHEEALITLVYPLDSPRKRQSMIRRAGVFFAEVMTPLEETRRGAIKASLKLQQMVGKLTQRTVELSTSNRNLTKEVARRKAAELSLRASERSAVGSLENARRLQLGLKLLSRQLLVTQEEERLRVSRELHDVVAQTLAGINLRLAALHIQASKDPSSLVGNITLTQRLVEESLDIVHRFAQDLRPPVLDHLGLIPALRSHLTAFMEQTGIRVQLTASAALETLDMGTRTVLYRVVQEALANVAKHAAASQASVVIHQTGGTLRMEVRDNGIGFLEPATVSARGRTSMGLLGMRERVEMIGGSFKVGGMPGEGTTILVELVLASSTAKKTVPKKPAKLKLKLKPS